MARNRMLRKEFFRDSKIGSLPFGARLLFQSLWIAADDRGNCIGDPRLIRGEAFPFDDLPVQTVVEWLDLLASLGMIVAYEAAGEKYLHIKNFLVHQKIDHPSKDGYPQPPATIETCSSKAQETLGEPSPSAQGEFGDEVNVIEFKSKEVNSKECKVTKGTATAKPENLTAVCDSQKPKDLTKATATADKNGDEKQCSRDTSDCFEFCGIDGAQLGEECGFVRANVSIVLLQYREKKHAANEPCTCSRKEFLGLVMDRFKQKKLSWPKCLLKLKNDATW
jgi:hypothetical protein